MTRAQTTRPPRFTRSAASLRWLVGAAALGLVLYHVFLLWDRIASRALLDPQVAVRWGLAGLLLLAMAHLRRAGVPLLRGRKALAVWALVALLHAGMVPGAGGLSAMLADAEVWLALSLASLAAFLGTLAGAVRIRPLRAAPGRPAPPGPVPSHAAFLDILSPRPPPAARFAA
ncbi:MAG: hypothetical protein GY719_24800 [bacterium]|nr:hypothetical protein [bacterium]